MQHARDKDNDDDVSLPASSPTPTESLNTSHTPSATSQQRQSVTDLASPATSHPATSQATPSVSGRANDHINTASAPGDSNKQHQQDSNSSKQMNSSHRTTAISSIPTSGSTPSQPSSVISINPKPEELHNTQPISDIDSTKQGGSTTSALQPTPQTVPTKSEESSLNKSANGPQSTSTSQLPSSDPQSASVSSTNLQDTMDDVNSVDSFEIGSYPPPPTLFQHQLSENSPRLRHIKSEMSSSSSHSTSQLPPQRVADNPSAPALERIPSSISHDSTRSGHSRRSVDDMGDDEENQSAPINMQETSGFGMVLPKKNRQHRNAEATARSNAAAATVQSTGQGSNSQQKSIHPSEYFNKYILPRFIQLYYIQHQQQDALDEEERTQLINHLYAVVERIRHYFDGIIGHLPNNDPKFTTLSLSSPFNKLVIAEQLLYNSVGNVSTLFSRITLPTATPQDNLVYLLRALEEQQTLSRYDPLFTQSVHVSKIKTGSNSNLTHDQVLQLIHEFEAMLAYHVRNISNITLCLQNDGVFFPGIEWEHLFNHCNMLGFRMIVRNGYNGYICLSDTYLSPPSSSSLAEVTASEPFQTKNILNMISQAGSSTPLPPPATSPAQDLSSLYASSVLLQRPALTLQPSVQVYTFDPTGDGDESNNDLSLNIDINSTPQFHRVPIENSHPIPAEFLESPGSSPYPLHEAQDVPLSFVNAQPSERRQRGGKGSQRSVHSHSSKTKHAKGGDNASDDSNTDDDDHVKQEDGSSSYIVFRRTAPSMQPVFTSFDFAYYIQLFMKKSSSSSSNRTQNIFPWKLEDFLAPYFPDHFPSVEIRQTPSSVSTFSGLPAFPSDGSGSATFVASLKQFYLDYSNKCREQAFFRDRFHVVSILRTPVQTSSYRYRYRFCSPLDLINPLVNLFSSSTRDPIHFQQLLQGYDQNDPDTTLNTTSALGQPQQLTTLSQYPTTPELGALLQTPTLSMLSSPTFQTPQRYTPTISDVLNTGNYITALANQLNSYGPVTPSITDEQQIVQLEPSPHTSSPLKVTKSEYIQQELSPTESTSKRSRMRRSDTAVDTTMDATGAGESAFTMPTTSRGHAAAAADDDDNDHDGSVPTKALRTSVLSSASSQHTPYTKRNTRENSFVHRVLLPEWNAVHSFPNPPIIPSKALLATTLKSFPCANHGLDSHYHYHVREHLNEFLDTTQSDGYVGSVKPQSSAENDDEKKTAVFQLSVPSLLSKSPIDPGSFPPQQFVDAVYAGIIQTSNLSHIGISQYEYIQQCRQNGTFIGKADRTAHDDLAGYLTKQTDLSTFDNHFFTLPVPLQNYAALYNTITTITTPSLLKWNNLQKLRCQQRLLEAELQYKTRYIQRFVLPDHGETLQLTSQLQGGRGNTTGGNNAIGDGGLSEEERIEMVQQLIIKSPDLPLDYQHYVNMLMEYDVVGDASLSPTHFIASHSAITTLPSRYTDVLRRRMVVAPDGRVLDDQLYDFCDDGSISENEGTLIVNIPQLAVPRWNLSVFDNTATTRNTAGASALTSPSATIPQRKTRGSGVDEYVNVSDAGSVPSVYGQDVHDDAYYQQQHQHGHPLPSEDGYYHDEASLGAINSLFATSSLHVDERASLLDSTQLPIGVFSVAKMTGGPSGGGLGGPTYFNHLSSTHQPHLSDLSLSTLTPVDATPFLGYDLFYLDNIDQGVFITDYNYYFNHSMLVSPILTRGQVPIPHMVGDIPLTLGKDLSSHALAALLSSLPASVPLNQFGANGYLPGNTSQLLHGAACHHVDAISASYGPQVASLPPGVHAIPPQIVSHVTNYQPFINHGMQSQYPSLVNPQHMGHRDTSTHGEGLLALAQNLSRGGLPFYSSTNPRQPNNNSSSIIIVENSDEDGNVTYDMPLPPPSRKSSTVMDTMDDDAVEVIPFNSSSHHGQQMMTELPEKSASPLTLGLFPPNTNVNNGKIILPIGSQTGIFMDVACLLHDSPFDDNSMFENPRRILGIMQAVYLHQFHRHPKVKFISGELPRFQELTLAHHHEYIEELLNLPFTDVISAEPLSVEEQCEYRSESIYVGEFSTLSALVALGGTISLTKQVVSGQLKNGFGIIRPPGHHCNGRDAYGFCLLNNAATAAQYAKQVLGLQRILILDWDVHYGNGTSQIFERDKDIVVINIHNSDIYPFINRHSEISSLYPSLDDAVGSNIDIGLTSHDNQEVGDGDYIYIMNRVVLPICYEFAPELIIVSCGFDAARHDQLGEFSLTPEGFAHMTHMLMPFAKGKLMLLLEGGYNPNSIALSTIACLNALCGDMHKIAPMRPLVTNESTKKIVERRVYALRNYWRCFQSTSNR